MHPPSSQPPKHHRFTSVFTCTYIYTSIRIARARLGRCIPTLATHATLAIMNRHSLTHCWAAREHHRPPPPLPPECGAPDTTVGQCNGVGCIAGCLHTPATYAPSHAMLPAAAASPRLASPYLSLRASQTPTTTPSGTCRRARRSACSADPTPDCSTLLAWLIDDVTTRPSTYWLMPSG